MAESGSGEQGEDDNDSARQGRMCESTAVTLGNEDENARLDS